MLSLWWECIHLGKRFPCEIKHRPLSLSIFIDGNSVWKLSLICSTPQYICVSGIYDVIFIGRSRYIYRFILSCCSIRPCYLYIGSPYECKGSFILSLALIAKKLLYTKKKSHDWQWLVRESPHITLWFTIHCYIDIFLSRCINSWQ